MVYCKKTQTGVSLCFQLTQEKLALSKLPWSCELLVQPLRTHQRIETKWVAISNGSNGSAAEVFESCQRLPKTQKFTLSGAFKPRCEKETLAKLWYQAWIMNSATQIFVSKQPLWKLWRWLGCIFLFTFTIRKWQGKHEWKNNKMVHRCWPLSGKSQHWLHRWAQVNKSIRLRSSCSFATVRDSVSQSHTWKTQHKVTLCCFVYRASTVKNNTKKTNLKIKFRPGLAFPLPPQSAVDLVIWPETNTCPVCAPPPWNYCKMS